MAMDLGEKVNTIATHFQKEEMYNLSNQIRRAADSVALNIAESSIGQSNLELKKFIGYSVRSLAEVVTCLHKAKRRRYILDEDFNLLYDQAFNLMNMMIAFRRNIK
jgi:four helix bundle protein